MSCPSDTEKGHDKCLVKFKVRREQIDGYKNLTENRGPLFEHSYNHIRNISKTERDYTVAPNDFNNDSFFPLLSDDCDQIVDSFIIRELIKTGKTTEEEIKQLIPKKEDSKEEKERKGKKFLEIKEKYTIPSDFSSRGLTTIPCEYPAKSTEVIVGLEFCIFTNSSGDEANDINKIAKLTGVYYCDIFKIGDRSAYMAYIDGKVTEEENLNVLIPKFGVNYLSLSKTIGYQNELTSSPVDLMKAENEEEAKAKNVYGQRRLLLAPLGHALTGIRFVNSTNGDRAIEAVECKFSKFYERETAPDVYKSLVNGNIINQQLTNTSDIYSIQCDKREYIQSLMFSYCEIKDAVELPGGIIGFAIDVVSFFKEGKINNEFSWTRFGLKAILESKKLIVENYDEMQQWIKDIVNLRTCDMTGETNYSDSSIEYIYAKTVLQQFLYQMTNYPSERCKVILTDHCNTIKDTEMTDDEDNKYTSPFAENLDSKLCSNFCGLQDSNCDKGILNFCNQKRFSKDIELNYAPNYTNEDKEGIWKPKSYDDIREELKRFVRVPIVPAVYLDKICPCTFSENPEHIDKIKKYYEDLMEVMKKESATMKSNELNKEYIEKDIINVKNIISDLDTFDAYKSFVASLKTRLLPDEYNKLIKETGKVRQQCSFPWCGRTNYKLYNMKQEPPCNETEECLTEGYTIYSTNDDGTQISCNRTLGFDAVSCVKPYDPSVATIVNPKRFLTCKKIMNPDYQPKIEWVPSFCELGDADFEDDSSLECLKDASNADMVFARRPKVTVENPEGGKDLCPAPWDTNGTHVNTSQKCNVDCLLRGDVIEEETCSRYNKRKIKQEVVKNTVGGKTCVDIAKQKIDNNLEWDVEEEDDIDYVYAYKDCVPTDEEKARYEEEDRLRKEKQQKQKEQQQQKTPDSKSPSGSNTGLIIMLILLFVLILGGLYYFIKMRRG